MMSPFIGNVNKGDLTCQEVPLQISHDEQSNTNYGSVLANSEDAKCITQRVENNFLVPDQASYFVRKSYSYLEDKFSKICRREGAFV